MEGNGVGGEGERNEKKIHPESRFHHITWKRTIQYNNGRKHLSKKKL